MTSTIPRKPPQLPANRPLVGLGRPCSRNYRYRSLVLYKLALLASLLFVALWNLFSFPVDQNGNPLPSSGLWARNTDSTGLRLREETGHIASPRSVKAPTSLSKQKEVKLSVAETYTRMIEEDKPWTEPTPIPVR